MATFNERCIGITNQPASHQTDDDDDDDEAAAVVVPVYI